jgi:hypothetical protein
MMMGSWREDGMKEGWEEMGWKGFQCGDGVYMIGWDE